MNFENNNNSKKIGKVAGFLITFLIFSIILFFILKFFDKIPESWEFYNVLIIPIILTIIGISIKSILNN